MLIIWILLKIILFHLSLGYLFAHFNLIYFKLMR